MRTHTGTRLAATAVAAALTVAAFSIPGCGVRTQTPDQPAAEVPGVDNDRAVQAIPQAEAAAEAARVNNEKAAEAQRQAEELTREP